MSTYHVMPVNDLIQHDSTADDACACGPNTEPVKRSDGSMGWLVVHHSLDGRERAEPAPLYVLPTTDEGEHDS